MSKAMILVEETAVSLLPTSWRWHPYHVPVSGDTPPPCYLEFMRLAACLKDDATADENSKCADRATELLRCLRAHRVFVLRREEPP